MSFRDLGIGNHVPSFILPLLTFLLSISPSLPCFVLSVYWLVFPCLSLVSARTRIASLLRVRTYRFAPHRSPLLLLVFCLACLGLVGPGPGLFSLPFPPSPSLCLPPFPLPFFSFRLFIPIFSRRFQQVCLSRFTRSLPDCCLLCGCQANAPIDTRFSAQRQTATAASHDDHTTLFPPALPRFSHVVLSYSHTHSVERCVAFSQNSSYYPFHSIARDQ